MPPHGDGTGPYHKGMGTVPGTLFQKKTNASVHYYFFSLVLSLSVYSRCNPTKISLPCLCILALHVHLLPTARTCYAWERTQVSGNLHPPGVIPTQ